METTMPLKWMVYTESINARCIKQWNVFDHFGFVKSLQKDLKEIKKDKGEISRDNLSAALKSNLMYYYWSKCEWEIILSDWPPSKKNFQAEKVDVYDQVRLNWEIFVDYVYNNLSALLRFKCT